MLVCLFTAPPNFNPPTPGGVGLDLEIGNIEAQSVFQSTHPGRGGTAKVYRTIPETYAKTIIFSIFKEQNTILVMLYF